MLSIPLAAPQRSITPLREHFGSVIQAGAGDTLLSLDPAEFAQLFRQRGALLFRGFPGDSASFVEFTQRYSQNFSTYQGGGFRIGFLNRQSIGGDPTLLSTTGHTQGFPIELHGEMYYIKQRPELLWFFCANAPAKAGETTICDGVELLRLLSPEVRELFASRRVTYIRHLRSQEWQTTYQTEDLEVVRQFCRENDMTLQVRADGSIETRFTCSPLITSPSLHQPAFINSIVQSYLIEWAVTSGWLQENIKGLQLEHPPIVVRFEDGSRIPDKIIDEIREVSERITLNVSWKNGDVLMIDNMRALHGRRQAVGSDRSIFVRLGQQGPLLRQPAVGA